MPDVTHPSGEHRGSDRGLAVARLTKRLRCLPKISAISSVLRRTKSTTSLEGAHSPRHEHDNDHQRQHTLNLSEYF